MTTPMDKQEPVAAHIILNIDDHDASRYVKSRILRSAGYHVIESRTGQDALSLAREVKPQLALLDVNLPDIDGFDLCRRLKHDPVTASIMVLLVSAVRVRNEDKVVGLEGGADAYLIEPVDPDELLATVKALIRLHRSEQRLHLALDIAELGSYSWDSSTGTLSCDARIKRMLGLPADAFVDYDVLMKAVHPDDRTAIQLHLAKAIDHSADGIYDMEFRIIGLEDGIERWVAARGQTWLNDGQLAGFTGTALEISKRKGVELDLARLKDELQTIFDSAPVMIWYKDTQNRILRVNQFAAESIGQTRASIEGRLVADLYPLEADRYYQDDLCVIKTGLPKLGIIEPYRLPSGEERWIQTDKVPLKDGRGAITGVLVLAVDITDRKKAEERLTNWNQDLEWAVCERTQELVASQDRLRTLATELNLVEQRERKRLATELHDYLAQLLVVAKLKLAQGRHQ
ncbi:MAG TPA: PAS domain S-box protein, partial [Nitrospiraceae bacterium]